MADAGKLLCAVSHMFLQELHFITSQRTAFFIVTAMKTSNLRYPDCEFSFVVREHCLHLHRTSCKLIVIYLVIYIFLSSRLEDRSFYTEW
jgi:hypothetical protein